MFNKPQGARILKFTPEVQEQAIELRKEGLSYKGIGDVLGLATMTIYRGLTGETKNVK